VPHLKETLDWLLRILIALHLQFIKRFWPQYPQHDRQFINRCGCLLSPFQRATHSYLMDRTDATHVFIDRSLSTIRALDL